jgi:N-acetylglucosaminyldiphosphoundecaprenol N-acetyl-beta-D-mannosaminyltransferase
VSIPVLVKKIIETNPDCSEMLERHASIYTFLNPVSYLEAVKNRDLYANFDGIFVDGKFLAVAIGLLYHKRVKRCSFDMTSLAPKLFSYSELHDKSIYIVAGQQEEIDCTIARFTEHYPKLKIVGARNGYFDSDQAIDSEIQKIVKMNPSFVICGMGAIKQENFLLRLKLSGYKGIAFTCGGFISQTSKSNFVYYPRVFDFLDLRFVYRMIKEKHTRKRYLQAFFWFPIRFIQEKVTG